MRHTGIDMKLTILSLFIFLTSCTDRGERLESTYTVSIRNLSNHSFSIKGYAPNNDLILDEIINPLSTGAECNYRAEVFNGFICGADSIRVKFDNGKGYICDVRQNGNAICFSNKFLFSSDAFIATGENQFQFEITQSDYENAFVLP